MNKDHTNIFSDEDINVDSLWLIKERKKTEKHKNIYHGNFIPQIPNQLIRRYTNENDVVLEPFAGSGTTLYECEKLNRRYIGFDINKNMINYIRSNMQDAYYEKNYYLSCLNVLDAKTLKKEYLAAESKLDINRVKLIIMHPPYMDIVKFTDDSNDLSKISTLKEFLEKFKTVCENLLQYLETNKYFALVIGDVYKKSEVIPLSFYCMDMIKRNFRVKLKGIVIKNIEGNRGKLGMNFIWKYRALKSDYFLFKHEYIFVFKKEF
jgi:16S rRNA G966 N2-methylase RsmD